jgi:hypothetical protein
MRKIFGINKNLLKSGVVSIDSEISLTDELNEIFSSLTEEEKMEKAIRHFYDGYFIFRLFEKDIY